MVKDKVLNNNNNNNNNNRKQLKLTQPEPFNEGGMNM